MGKDYYSILGVTRAATNLQIAAQFRILALQTHPDKNKDNGRLALCTYAFSEICEAYEVLSTPELRDVYDKYGEELMKSGVPNKKYGFTAGYTFQGNSLDIFEKFFGTANPFTVALDEHGNQIGMLQAKSMSFLDAFAVRFSNLTVTVSCTLEEFYYGCQKNISFERLYVQGDGKAQKIAVASKVIHVKPGHGPHTQLTFPGEGHQRPGQKQSDLVIVFKQKPHDKFKRFGNDLILEHKISLYDALLAGAIKFKTIEDEQIEISADDVINPDTFKVIPGKGMPILNDDPLGPIKRDYAKGNLILKFDIQFPEGEMDENWKNKFTGMLEALEEHNQEMEAMY